MILPSSTEIIRADQLKAISDNRGQTIRDCAVVDAIIYAVSGTGTLVVKEGFGGELRHHDLQPGDFAFVPAWTEHQARNDMDQDLVWVVVQSGPRPVGAILADWGSKEVKTIE
ncbi:cupin [Trichoderma cornu-damae]|uniref:Cupin n=1 Tax=Trichoderma cornu-damae TaxID=654480 RepID=A0A9P8TUZ2_9HYPO|nr:cupin [Trichoderma cornu-damae]